MINTYDIQFLTQEGIAQFIHMTDLRAISYSYNELLTQHNLIENGYTVDVLNYYLSNHNAVGNHEQIAYHLINGNKITRFCNVANNGDDVEVGMRFIDKNGNQLVRASFTTYNSWGALTCCCFYVIVDTGNNNYLGVGILRKRTDQDNFYVDFLLSPSSTLTPTINNFFAGSEVTEDPYQTAPGSEAGGGYGDFDYTSDDIDFSPLPTLSVVDSGFVTLYNPSIGQLKSLAQYMWSGLFDINTFRKIFADPMDCIISLAMIPLTPPATSSQELKVGNIGTGITINRLSSQFVEVNFAMKNIGLRSNGFMDFSPYTKAQIFLPYIGIRSLSIDDIAGKDLTLKYKIDLFTGACNAAIKCGTSVLYQFTGNVIANIPITAQNFSGMLQAAIGAVGAAVGVATGAGALAGVASAINAATSMKPDIEKSGNLSATAGFLGQQMPYLILTYPNLCRPEGRDKTVGTPSFLGLSASNPTRPLSSFHGITKLHKINVKSIPCTDAERDEIEALLMEGVIMP